MKQSEVLRFNNMVGTDQNWSGPNNETTALTESTQHLTVIPASQRYHHLSDTIITSAPPQCDTSITSEWHQDHLKEWYKHHLRVIPAHKSDTGITSEWYQHLQEWYEFQDQDLIQSKTKKWFYVVDFWLHFIYVQYLHFNIQIWIFFLTQIIRTSQWH